LRGSGKSNPAKLSRLSKKGTVEGITSAKDYSKKRRKHVSREKKNLCKRILLQGKINAGGKMIFFSSEGEKGHGKTIMKRGSNVQNGILSNI